MSAVVQDDLLRRHRLTVDEFYRMAEVGLLAPDARVELIDGEVIDMAPIGDRHGAVVAWLMERLLRQLAGRATVWCQSTLRLDGLSAPQPDMAVLRYRADSYKSVRANVADILLLIEVSDTSFRYDRNIKVPLYARHAIPETWIVELERPHLHIFRSLERQAYAHSSKTERPGSLQLEALPDLTIDLTGLLEGL
jgi:Uma2 family endonuclease